jgi:hypothetical protein
MHWTEIVERRIGDVVIFDLHGQMTLSGEESPRLLLQVRRASSAGPESPSQPPTSLP